MSLLFRAALNQGVKTLRTPKCAASFLKFDVNVCLPSGSNCRCKALLTLSSPIRRDYSTQIDDKSATNKATNSDIETIYTGFLVDNVRRIKFLSLCTSFMGLGVQPLVYIKAVSAGETSNYTLPLFALIGSFAIATPVLLNIVTKRYVLQVDYNRKTDKYIAHVYNLFLMRKKIEFTPEDITIPTVLGMFANCAIKGNPAFMDAQYFTDQAHYIRIMGYDKPLDLQVEPSESPPKKVDNDNNKNN